MSRRAYIFVLQCLNSPGSIVSLEHRLLIVFYLVFFLLQVAVRDQFGHDFRHVRSLLVVQSIFQLLNRFDDYVFDTWSLQQ